MVEMTVMRVMRMIVMMMMVMITIVMMTGIMWLGVQVRRGQLKFRAYHTVPPFLAIYL